MDNNEFEKETVVSGTDVTPDMTENVTEEVQAEETIASVEIEEPKAEVKAPAAEVTPVKKKSKRQLKKEEKKRLSQYHIGSWDIIKNYRNYNEAEKAHYRYILGRRVSEKVWPIFRFLILFGLGFVILYPMLYMLSCSIRPQAEMSDPSIL
ncbi:MAG: carbohydrate ABC transporter permease, partial [Ruminiclostridium sp.]|nr:carbohydrate ABC transporter permease [Ruminiclostridium sp.]